MRITIEDYGEWGTDTVSRIASPDIVVDVFYEMLSGLGYEETENEEKK